MSEKWKGWKEEEGRSHSASGNRVNHPSPTTNHALLSFEFTQPMSRRRGVERDCHLLGNNYLSGASARRIQVGNLRNYRSAQGHVIFFLNFHFSQARQNASFVLSQISQSCSLLLRLIVVNKVLLPCRSTLHSFSNLSRSCGLLSAVGTSVDAVR